MSSIQLRSPVRMPHVGLFCYTGTAHRNDYALVSHHARTAGFAAWLPSTVRTPSLPGPSSLGEYQRSAPNALWAAPLHAGHASLLCILVLLRITIELPESRLDGAYRVCGFSRCATLRCTGGPRGQDWVKLRCRTGLPCHARRRGRGHSCTHIAGGSRAGKIILVKVRQSVVAVALVCARSGASRRSLR